MKPKQVDVLVVGDIFVDIVMSGFPDWPKPGQEAFAKEMLCEVGGGAAITACGLSRLNVTTGVVGLVENDGDVGDGGWITKRLSSFGVSTTMLEKHPTEPTGITIAVSSNRDRAFFTYPGANTGLPELLARSDVRSALETAAHVHFACRLDPLLLIELTESLHAQGTRVSLDVGWHPDWLGDRNSIRAVGELDWFMPNETEAEVMTGKSDPDEILDAFERMGIRRVALKLGERGAALIVDGSKVFVDPLKVQVVDTTGAGDSFDAGFIYGSLRGQSPERCLSIANMCGALSTRALGGITAFPSESEISK